MSAWIKLSDRLPEIDQNVLCLDDHNKYFTAYYSRMQVNYEPFHLDCWHHDFCCGREPEDPIYWMPLPELPEQNTL